MRCLEEADRQSSEKLRRVDLFTETESPPLLPSSHTLLFPPSPEPSSALHIINVMVQKWLQDSFHPPSLN